MKNIPCVLSLGLLLVACQPKVAFRGNALFMEKVDHFVVGQTTMADVINQCGTPFLHENNFVWIYVSAIAEDMAFSETSLKDRKVVKLIFDKNKVLRSIEKIPQSDVNKFLQDDDIIHLKTEKQIVQRLNRSQER